MQHYFDALIRHPFFTGVMGGLVAAARSSPGASWSERMVNIACGGILTAYLAPAIGVRAGIDDAAELSALAFIIGMVGMTIIGGILSALRKTDWKAVLESWLKKGK